jgi:putative Holliday junction resolvase
LQVGQRVLGIDYGQRRIGLAISDATRTLARPLSTLRVTEEDAVARVVGEVERLASEEDGLAAIVVGLPTRLDGTPNEQTSRVMAFIESLAAETRLPVTWGDERLSSREAESRLAQRERSWQRRKARLDAAAAAVMLQDYLDVEARKHRKEG